MNCLPSHTFSNSCLTTGPIQSEWNDLIPFELVEFCKQIYSDESDAQELHTKKRSRDDLRIHLYRNREQVYNSLVAGEVLALLNLRKYVAVVTSAFQLLLSPDRPLPFCTRPLICPAQSPGTSCLVRIPTI